MLVVDAADVDDDPEESCDPYNMLQEGSWISPKHTIPPMAEATIVAYLIARRCPHKRTFVV